MSTDNVLHRKVLPGAWLGVLGGGQLGRMFCHAAQAMGYKVAVLEPDAGSPAGMVADRHIQAQYDDPDALETLAQLCEAVTTEFENVPAAALDKLAETVRVSPPGRAVAIAQDRIAEKQFLAQCVGVAPHRVIESQTALDALDDSAFNGVLPGILKTARMGYDGKGQIRVATVQEVRDGFAQLGGAACILEKRLSLDYEVSALVVRGADGATVVYPIAQNTHIDGILAETVVPAPKLDLMTGGLSQARLAAQIADQARTIVTALGYVGVLCIEFFVLTDGTLVANEMAPRPHNSGHYTIDACVTSQFEQQVRAMTGLPLGDTRQHSPAVMLNVLGDIWFQSGNGETARTPAWDMAAALPEVHIHLYGKEAARKGRKMGHITATGPDAASAKQRARQVAQDLGLPTVV
ncbi:5-(carboxyamino)imidazole ribonucleotide synthase [Robbsia sp. KACC 23696]|uniref:5-(carboxyamino)imidazole ribonucleotide synthase n=1 Tax=Robbsia sp. KACC 23696 TaxID=3149231 RepID=UPI00325B5ED1